MLAVMLPHAAKDPWYEQAWQAVLDWLPVAAILESVAIVITAIIVGQIFTWIIDRIVRRATKRARRERLADARSVARTAELSEVIMSQRTEQRAHAVGSLAKSTVRILVWSVSILMILNALGISIGPLLASAGVVGVVLGFGAQTLVRDYLAGIFLIVEDQIGVGDVVDLGSLVGSPVIGTVEEVALRYTQIRDAEGIVWYVRNGEITRVGNRSQGWTMAIVDFPIPYDADLGKVRKIVNAVGLDMYEDPEYDDSLLSQPTFVGLESVTHEGNATGRILAKALPQTERQLSRRIRERVVIALDRAGIGSVPVHDEGDDEPELTGL